MAVKKTPFGVICGENVDEYEITRGAVSVGILNFGGIVRSFKVKTAKGVYDIVLGYNTAGEYEADGATYFGSVVGRVANRIAGAKFALCGKEYPLFANDGKNTLHGGKVGFNRKLWRAEIKDEYSVALSYESQDGEEGFPANLKVTVVYSVTERNGLKIEYFAKSDGATPVSLTNHSYFNLNGDASGDVLGHVLKICADDITPVRADLIPTGEYKKVAGTAFDFTVPKEIGKDIGADDEQIKICGGYDINYVKTHKGYALVAEAVGDKSGITMRVYSTENGVQFYSGNFMKGIKGKTGVYGNRGGFCLETQGFPNAVNTQSFPSVILYPDKKYESVTEYVIIP